jgi:hypothetical protein
MAGDSTMANKEVESLPGNRMGKPFTYFFDSTVTVDNRPKSGEARTFISEVFGTKADRCTRKEIMFLSSLDIMMK